jgi:hypothetical protein
LLLHDDSGNVRSIGLDGLHLVLFLLNMRQLRDISLELLILEMTPEDVVLTRDNVETHAPESSIDCLFGGFAFCIILPPTTQRKWFQAVGPREHAWRYWGGEEAIILLVDG